MVYISTKFGENILNGLRVKKRTSFQYLLETFSVKLGHLLLFLSLVLPFTKLQNNSPGYHQTSCLLFTEVDKDAKTSLRFVRIYLTLARIMIPWVKR